VRNELEKHGETVHGLPPGRRLFAIDLSDKSALKLGV